MPIYNIHINGSVQTVDVTDPEQPLLYVLRGLGFTAAKFGCGMAQCGACNVLIDGEAVRSCSRAIADMQGKSITTLEGLGSLMRRTRSRLHSSRNKCRNAATAPAA